MKSFRRVVLNTTACSCNGLTRIWLLFGFVMLLATSIDDTVVLLAVCLPKNSPISRALEL